VSTWLFFRLKRPSALACVMGEKVFQLCEPFQDARPRTADGVQVRQGIDTVLPHGGQRFPADLMLKQRTRIISVRFEQAQDHIRILADQPLQRDLIVI
jgi:hypothetical protein